MRHEELLVVRAFYNILFIISLLGLCWLGMMALHELGHVLGGLITGGNVEKVVLHPWAISRTDVSPNPHPTIVVWLGPSFGVVLPMILWGVLSWQGDWTRGISQFFVGFCLVANGAYIGLGSLAGIGDCGEMMRTGSPIWALWLFGIITLPVGIWLWHRLGSPADLFLEANFISARTALATSILLIVLAATEAWLSSVR